MITILGAIDLERWFVAAGVGHDSILAVSDRGCSKVVLIREWPKHYVQFTAHRLILPDGYDSHCTKEFLNFCLPPHTNYVYSSS